MSKKTDELKSQVKDLLNQVAILLKDVELPEIDSDYGDDYGFSSIPVGFVGRYEKDLVLPSIKVVVEGMISDIESKNKYSNDSEKMARAYYSSFCNG